MLTSISVYIQTEPLHKKNYTFKHTFASHLTFIWQNKQHYIHTQGNYIDNYNDFNAVL